MTKTRVRALAIAATAPLVLALAVGMPGSAQAHTNGTCAHSDSYQRDSLNRQWWTDYVRHYTTTAYPPGHYHQYDHYLVPGGSPSFQHTVYNKCSS